jgi:hypothetical protein
VFVFVFFARVRLHLGHLWGLLRCQGSPTGELQKSDQDWKQENLLVHVRKQSTGYF